MRIKIAYRLSLSALVSFFLLSAAMAHAECPRRSGGHPDCSGGHCSRVDQDQSFNSWCIDAGFSGCPILLKESSKSCFCICSCVAGDTQIVLANGVVKLASDLEEGDELSSPYSAHKTSKVFAVTISDAAGFEVLKIFVSNGKNITVSPNHIFLGVDGKFHSADDLKMGEVLVSEGALTVVEKIEKIDSYSGNLYNVIINNFSEDSHDHLFLTNGFVSADFVLQNSIDGQRAAVAADRSDAL